ncbi:MAG: peptidoglycan DD-metalloendopeptidase family protein [Gammaproteobacteria bacterium]
MKRKTWLWIGLGSAGALLLLGRNRSWLTGGSFVLGSPVAAGGTPKVTPRGHFGAHRDGPPVHAHQGVDLAAPPGSYVLAVGDGVIVPTSPGLGQVVRKLKLDVPASWGFGQRRVDSIVYADLGTPLVHAGDRVREGDPIARVWNRGFVHFAVKEARPGAEVFFDPKEAGFAYRLSTGLEVA